MHILLQRGRKYRPLDGLDSAEDLVSATDTEVDVADDGAPSAAKDPSDIVFVSLFEEAPGKCLEFISFLPSQDLNRDGTLYVDMVSQDADKILSVDDFRHVCEVGARIGRVAGAGAKGGRGKGKTPTAPTRVSPRKRPAAEPSTSPQPSPTKASKAGPSGSGGGEPPKKPGRGRRGRRKARWNCPGFLFFPADNRGL